MRALFEMQEGLRECRFRTPKQRHFNLICFAEFDSIGSAVKARENLDGYMLPECHYSSVPKLRNGLVCDFASPERKPQPVRNLVYWQQYRGAKPGDNLGIANGIGGYIQQPTPNQTMAMAAAQNTIAGPTPATVITAGESIQENGVGKPPSLEAGGTSSTDQDQSTQPSADGQW